MAYLVRRLTCKRCGHKWVPRKNEVYTCPNYECRSAKWDVDKAVDPPQINKSVVHRKKRAFKRETLDDGNYQSIKVVPK